MTYSEIVLASASPRRRLLLESAGVAVVTRPADIDEQLLADEPPEVYVDRVARMKAATIADTRPVLAADTVVVLDGVVLGKPASDEDAWRTLRALSGRRHVVMTAVVLRLGTMLYTHRECSWVTMRELDDASLGWYISTGEPRDKAGAYGIQGHGVGLIEQVEGSYTNVVGLPLVQTLALLRRARITA